jgi:hypothetical protein
MSIAKLQPVKLSKLAGVPAAGTRMTGADERRRQAQERERGYTRRIGQLRR